jgi:hypothetical protein
MGEIIKNKNGTLLPQIYIYLSSNEPERCNMINTENMYADPILS